LNARVASTGSNWVFWDGWCRLWLSSRSLWCNGLGSAVNDLTALNETLDHPVVHTVAENTVIDTGLAEIKVAIIAGTAVVVNIGDCGRAVVAVNREYADCSRIWTFVVATAKSTLSLVGQASKLSKPSVTSSGTSGDWNLRARAGVHLGSIPSRVIPNRVESFSASLRVVARKRVDEGR